MAIGNLSGLMWLVGILISPVSLSILSILAIVVYKFMVRPTILKDGNNTTKVKELVALFTAKSIILLVAAMLIGKSSTRAGELSIRLKFVIAILLLELVSLSNHLVEILRPHWRSVHKISLVNFVKAGALVLLMVFLVGSPDNLGERIIKYRFITLVLVFEAIAIIGSAWFGSSLIPNFIPI
jgi:hypothetical protein